MVHLYIAEFWPVLLVLDFEILPFWTWILVFFWFEKPFGVVSRMSFGIYKTLGFYFPKKIGPPIWFMIVFSSNFHLHFTQLKLKIICISLHLSNSYTTPKIKYCVLIVTYNQLKLRICSKRKVWLLPFFKT
jgi:hypothetical protein